MCAFFVAVPQQCQYLYQRDDLWTENIPLAQTALTTPLSQNMSLSLSGKVVIVTGASRGIGAATAARLAEDGATVVVNYYNSKAAADGLVERINAEEKGKAVAIKADMSSLVEAKQLVEETLKQFGRLDILALNAAIVIDGTLDTITEENFDKQFDVNVKIPLFMVQTAAKSMEAG